MRTVHDRDCPVFVGRGSLEKLQDFLQKKSQDFRIIWVHDLAFSLNPIIMAPIFAKVPLLSAHNFYTLEATEANKHMEGIMPLLQEWSDDRLDRNTLVVAVGGGVLCDMVGFAASIYKRGIPFIHVPTTLLAMADASVGGKTAVDLGNIKNILGTFTRPMAVVADPIFLNTLPQEHYLSGMAEILKMQLIGNRRFKPEVFFGNLFDPLFCEEVLYFAIKEKARITRIDFQEKGLRKTLNFGHTFGHAFESLALAKGDPIPHGFAVAHGMVCELLLTRSKDAKAVRTFTDTMARIVYYYGLSLYAPEDIPTLLSYMKHDKKNVDQEHINCSLLKKYGVCKYDVALSLQQVQDVLAAYHDSFTENH